MTMIAKIFRTYISLGNLGLSLEKVHCFPRKVPLPQKLEPYPNEKSFIQIEVIFFIKEFFLFHGEFAWD
jgi:hypothetical protein